MKCFRSVILSIMQCSCSYSNLKNSFSIFLIFGMYCPTCGTGLWILCPFHKNKDKILRSTVSFPKQKDSIWSAILVKLIHAKAEKNSFLDSLLLFMSAPVLPGAMAPERPPGNPKSLKQSFVFMPPLLSQTGHCLPGLLLAAPLYWPILSLLMKGTGLFLCVRLHLVAN